jgi:SecD/SecF fusion protein
MSNRPLIIFLTVVISILCAFYLTFTYVARNVQKNAEKYATDAKGNINYPKKQKYLDSINTQTVYDVGFASYTYEEVKRSELSLGLDLQGGMHVTLEVIPSEVAKNLAARKAKDEKFIKALALAETKRKSSQASFGTLLAQSIKEVSPDKNMAFYFANTTNKGITLQSKESDVISMLDNNIEESVDLAYKVLQNRIDKFGVSNPTIQKLPASGRIQIELPGVDNPERAKKLLSGAARLEFWEVFDMQELSPALMQLMDYVDKTEGKGTNADTKKGSNPFTTDSAKQITKRDTTKDKVISQKDTTQKDLKDAKDPKKSNKSDNPFEVKPDSSKKDTTNNKNKKDTTKQKDDKASKKDTTKSLKPGSVFSKLFASDGTNLYVALKDTSKVNAIFAKTEVKAMMPATLVVMWGIKPTVENKTSPLFGLLPIYFLKQSGIDGKPLLGGDVISDASQDNDQRNGQPTVSMQMNIAGAREWQRITRENTGKFIAIALDNYVYSAPKVNGEIAGGNSSISGNFTIDEAKDLANILKAGKLPAPTRVVEEATVGPTLGQESITQGLISTIVSMLIVFAFMIVYYNLAGVIACVALLANILFTLGVMAQFGTVLTLSGIAGFVLSTAMSVDANVLIYERVREELQLGKTVKEAVSIGFSKAYSAILDSNITTFLIGVILFWLGEGLVRGFAITLMIGIICSLFCAVFITRLIIEWALSSNIKLTFKSLFFNNTYAKTTFDFVKIRKKAYLVSAAIILVGIVLTVVQGGLTLGVDFKGGRSYTVAFKQAVPVNDVREELNKVFKSTEVKTYNSNNQVKITTSYLVEDDSENGDKKVKETLINGLAKYKSLEPTILSSSKIGATIANDILKTSQLAVLISLIAMFLYILARFQHWQYSLGATIALFHNVLIVLAFTAILQVFGISLEIDQVFIASILTVIGYSINDTVVVFDRIREFAKEKIEASNFGQKLNEAINDTLSRTIVTGTTTILTTLILLIFAGEVLRGFSFAMFIGIVFGTYSSIFIASPIVLDFARRKGAEEAKKEAALAEKEAIVKTKQ